MYTKNVKFHRHPARAMLGRDFRLLLREVPGALLTAVLLGIFCILAVSALSHGADSDYTPAPIAVVDEGKSLTSGMAISMIARQEFAAPLEIVKASAAQAEAGLRDGTYSAALYLPKGYMEDILTGTAAAARLVLSERIPLHADVVKLLCSFGEELLSTGQYGVFAGEELVLETAPDRHSAYLKKSNALFLGQALADPGFLREQTAYSSTGVSADNWYLLVYAAAFFQLLCLACFFAVRDCTAPMLRRLRAEGIRDGVFLGSKFLLLLGLYLALAFGLLVWMQYPLTGACVLSVAAAAAMSAAVGLAVLVCFSQSHAVTAATALTAVGLFTSGGIVPRMELPEVVTLLGDLMPVGAAAKTAGAVFGGGISRIGLLACLGWAVLAWSSMLVQLRRLRKGVSR